MEIEIHAVELRRVLSSRASFASSSCSLNILVFIFVELHPCRGSSWLGCEALSSCQVVRTPSPKIWRRKAIYQERKRAADLEILINLIEVDNYKNNISLKRAVSYKIGSSCTWCNQIVRDFHLLIFFCLFHLDTRLVILPHMSLKLTLQGRHLCMSLTPENPMVEGLCSQGPRA